VTNLAATCYPMTWLWFSIEYPAYFTSTLFHLFLDKEKRYRIINNFKLLGRRPDRLWDSLIEDSIQPSEYDLLCSCLYLYLWQCVEVMCFLMQLNPVAR